MPEENFSSLKKAGTSIKNLMEVLLLIGFVGFLGYFYLFAVVGIPFYTTHRLFYFIVMNMLFFGLLGLFICAVSKKEVEEIPVRFLRPRRGLPGRRRGIPRVRMVDG